MTDKEKKEWIKAYAPIIERDKKEDEKRLKCLEIVESNVTTELYAEILEYIKECDFTDSFEITEEIPNEETKQKEDGDLLNEVWVDQYCNGGYVGDDFAGWVHIKINKTEYLKYHYSM